MSRVPDSNPNDDPAPEGAGWTVPGAMNWPAGPPAAPPPASLDGGGAPRTVAPPAPPSGWPPGMADPAAEAFVRAMLALWWGYGWSTGTAANAAPLPDAPPGPAKFWPTAISWMRFDPGRPPPRWGLPDVLLAFVAFFAGSIVFAIPTALVTTDKSILTVMSLIGSWVGTVGYLFLISKWKGQRSLRRDFGLRFRLIDVPIGFGAAVVTIFASLIVRLAVAALFNDTAGTNTADIFGTNPSKAGVIVMTLLAAIGAPIVEELLFRGLVLRAIERRLGGVAGVVGSMLLFGLLHFPGGSAGAALSLMAGIAVYGLVFAVIDRWWGRLGPSIVAHMMLNSLASAVVIYQVFSGQPITG